MTRKFEDCGEKLLVKNKQLELAQESLRVKEQEVKSLKLSATFGCEM